MKKALLLTSFVFGLQSMLTAQITTAPVGFNTVTCLPNSDTYCSVPFAQSWDFQGLISGTPSVAEDEATITPQGTVAWTENQFATLYFVRILTGAKAGMYFQILSNTTGTLTIDLAGGDLAGVANGDGLAVSKFWTLGSLFPPATQTTIVASTSQLPAGRRTQILLPDSFSNGVNLAPSRIYYLHNGNWKNSSGNTVSDDVILVPDQYFIIRHPSSVASQTTYTATGIVELNPVAIPLATQASTQQDNPVATGRPIPIKLTDLGLISSGSFVGSSGTLPGVRRDLLLLYDNSVATVNRAPSKIYYYNSSTGHWLNASGNVLADDDEIAPSTAILIRKYQSGTGFTAVWTQTF